MDVLAAPVQGIGDVPGTHSPIPVFEVDGEMTPYICLPKILRRLLHLRAESTPKWVTPEMSLLASKEVGAVDR